MTIAIVFICLWLVSTEAQADGETAEAKPLRFPPGGT